MFKNNYIATTKNLIVLICLYTLTSTSMLYAITPTSNLVQHGQMLYEQGDTYGAMNDFAYALLYDIDNKKIQGYLFDFISSQNIRINDRMLLLKIKGEMNYIHNLEAEISYYQQILSILEKRNYKEKTSINNNYNKNVKNTYYKYPKNYYSTGYIHEDNISYKSKKILSQLYFTIENKKNNLKERLLVLKQKYNILRQHGKKRIVTKDIKTQKKIYAARRYYHLKSSHSRNRIKKVTLALQEAENTKQKNKVEDVKQTELLNQLNKLKGYIKKQEEKIISLKRQLSTNSSSCPCEKSISKNDYFYTNNIIKQLKDQIAELKARIELSEKIIKEKDKKINELNRLLMTKKSIYDKNNNEDSQDWNEEEIKKLQGLLNIYKAKLQDAIKEKDKNKLKIVELQQKISNLSYKEKKLSSIKKEVNILQKELYNLKDKIILLEQKSLQKGRLDKEDNKDIYDLKRKLDDIDKFLRHELIGLDEIMSNSYSGGI